MAAISTAPAEFAEWHGGTPRCSGRPRRDGLTLLLLASIIVSFLAASSAPTPLYALYARQWGFSPLATTVVFGAYALAVLAGLLAFGKPAAAPSGKADYSHAN